MVHRLGTLHGGVNGFVGLETIFVVIEVERDQQKDILKDLVDERRAAVVIVDCRDQPKGVADHNEVDDFAGLEVAERDH